MGRFDALAYGRYVWDTGNDQIDVERILTNNLGVSVWDAKTRTLHNVIVPTDVEDPEKPVRVSVKSRYRLYKWTSLITVAPAKKICTALDALCSVLDQAQLTNGVLARLQRVIRTTDANAEYVKQIVNMCYEGFVPVMDIGSDLNQDDIITLGDGDTHAQSIRELYDVAVGRAAQLLGVHYGDTVKAERLITDEAEKAASLVNIAHAREVAQRDKLAAWTGWTYREVI